MRSTELFRSCANEHVAGSALACIGGMLHQRVKVAAHLAGVSSGAYVVRLVAAYDRKASPRRRKCLEKSMGGDPMPILAGLRHVVESALEGDWDVAAPKPESSPDAAQSSDVHWTRGPAPRSRRSLGPKRLHS